MVGEGIEGFEQLLESVIVSDFSVFDGDAFIDAHLELPLTSIHGPTLIPVGIRCEECAGVGRQNGSGTCGQSGISLLNRRC